MNDNVSGHIHADMPVLLVSAVLGTILCWIGSLVYRRWRLSALSDIPGPMPQSIFTGNFPELNLPECGTTERRWQEEFGQVVRMKGAFGENLLWVADPKALQHMLQASGYNYRKLQGPRVIAYMLSDDGLFWAEDDVHKRQRKAMAPAFGMSESRSFMPDFRNAVDSIVDKWNDQIASGPSGKSSVIDIPHWLSRATLDAIGTAAFDYDFGSVKNLNDPLTLSYQNIFVAAFGTPSPGKLFWENMYNDIPASLLHFLYEFLPGEGLKKVRTNRSEAHKVAHRLYDQKINDLRNGIGRRDLMSLLVKAKAPKNEIIPQMRSIMLAGHETSANTIVWTLYELAKRPEMQARVRAEILETRKRALSRGDKDITASDLDQMSYTVAVMKESMRFHPVVFRIFREAVKDDVLPLYTPITTKSGKVVKEIAVPKGTRFWISIHGYHINKEVWGPDANEFNPERWLVPRNPDIPTVGVYGNLLAFSAGVKSCIGWRFAIVEVQTFLISLISNFEFSIPEGSRRIYRGRAGVITPMFEGEIERGAQLPLNVSLVSRTL